MGDRLPQCENCDLQLSESQAEHWLMRYEQAEEKYKALEEEYKGYREDTKEDIKMLEIQIEEMLNEEF